MGYGNTPKWVPNDMVVPFDSNGNLADWLYGNITWQKVAAFKSSMKVLDYSNTAGSATVTVMDNQGIKYPIYLSDLMDVLKTRKIEAGYIEESVWTFKKKGRTYSIKLDTSV